MAVQSIVGSRYKHFAVPAVEWQKALTCVSDVAGMLIEIQRTWSYLEPLFIGSEEVKRELPEDARRFLDVDAQVKMILQKAYKAKNVKIVCQQAGANITNQLPIKPTSKRMEKISTQTQIFQFHQTTNKN
jgi:dynein heavy chain